MPDEHDDAATPFHDLTEYVAIPRLGGLAVSPDGTRLVTTVSTLSADGKKYVGALWEIDPAGERAARRLTRSAPGESHPAFLPDGRLLFVSRRPDPAAKPGDEDKDTAALWVLPAGAGEARQIAARRGGIDEVVVAAASGEVVVTAQVLPGAATAEEDDDRRKARKDAGVTAILHERHPVRYWDHDLGPDEAHVLVGDPLPETDDDWDLVDATPSAEGRIGENLAVSPDGRLVAVDWRVDDAPAVTRTGIAVLDAATGERVFLLEAEQHFFSEPTFGPTGRTLLAAREGFGGWDEAPDRTLWLVDLDTGEGRDLLPGSTLWPHRAVFAPDGSAVYLTADDQGHAPVFRVGLADGTVTRLTAGGGHSDLVITADGSALYALRSTVAEPPTPVRIDPGTPDQEPHRLPAPGGVTVPGTVTEVIAHADDGVSVHGWLVLPEGVSAESPAPLLLWIHGGPLSSYNAWSWRWNPWLMASRGYAVLLPDPALSTGYGLDFIRRGWGTWGGRPFTDLMAATDAVCARPDIDETRTGAMGGSFGGYMANWVATQTDRFRGIVTHASLWHLDQFGGTTDEPSYWANEFGDPLVKQERYVENSPHLRVADIRTPMLVIHGDRDYRVPIGEALRLWYDLCRFSVPAKFLYFPDENHWVLTPGHARVWYETVLAFLAEHVLDEDWQRPALL